MLKLIVGLLVLPVRFAAVVIELLAMRLLTALGPLAEVTEGTIETLARTTNVLNLFVKLFMIHTRFLAFEGFLRLHTLRPSAL